MVTLLRANTKEIRRFIALNLEDNSTTIVALVAQKFNISRQAAHQHISKMMREGLIGAMGKTSARKYFPVPLMELREEIDLNGKVEEDIIWREIVLPQLGRLNEGVAGICQYGFTEMVNNVIDHSAGTRLTISASVTISRITFVIGDNGVGIFNKLQRELGLENPRHAILELYKGKITTDPENHSGEGIFFTSRMFDNFYIESGSMGFWHLKSGNDFLLTEDFSDFEMVGTMVRLDISSQSKKRAQTVFEQFSTGDEMGFTRTKIPVLLAKQGNENLVSRSQAKRLLLRLDKFKEIWLDFDGVETIGQGFADEIFRVYANQNPDVQIMVSNISDEVRAMIEHVAR